MPLSGENVTKDGPPGYREKENTRGPTQINWRSPRIINEPRQPVSAMRPTTIGGVDELPTGEKAWVMPWANPGRACPFGHGGSRRWKGCPPRQTLVMGCAAKSIEDLPLMSLSSRRPWDLEDPNPFVSIPLKHKVCPARSVFFCAFRLGCFQARPRYWPLRKAAPLWL
jgi:hypothetical protein